MLFSNQKTEVKSIFSGTLVASGLAVYRVTTIGPNTEVGKLEVHYKTSKKHLLHYKFKFKICESDGNYGCFLISLVLFWKTHNLLTSLLKDSHCNVTEEISMKTAHRQSLSLSR
jgi:Ca2+-transporting ATPase